MVDLCPDSFPLNKVRSGTTPADSRLTHRLYFQQDTSLATPKGKAGFAPSSSKSKNAITPAQGSASLLSFFSRKTPAASTSSPVNPVKVVAANKKVQLVANPSRSDDAKENEAVERKSKFFGAPAKKQTEAVRPDDEVVIVEASVVQVEEVEMQEDLPASDADAEAALRDVELEVELRSAVSVSSGGSTDAAVLRPEEDDVAVDGGAKSDVPAPRSDNAPGLAVTPGRQSRELSLPSAISSPASTPCRKRRKLSHDPDDLSHMPALTEQDDVLESDGGISSPAAASTAAEAGWASTSEAGDLPVSDVLSSPVKPVPVEALRIKRELDDNAAMKQPAAQLGLSSDPILLSSDVVDADDLFERTPRPGPNRKSPRRIKGPKAPAKSSSGAVKPKLVRDSKKKAVEVLEDTPKAAAKTGSSKKSASRKKASEEEEEDEAISEAVKTVAASWRARFMMPAAGVRVSMIACRGSSMLADPNAPVDSSLKRSGLRWTPPDANNDLATSLGTEASDGNGNRRRESEGRRNLDPHPALASLDESHCLAPDLARRRPNGKVIVRRPSENPHSNVAAKEGADLFVARRHRTLARPLTTRSGYVFLAGRRHEPSTPRLPLHRYGQAQLSEQPILVDLRNPQLSQVSSIPASPSLLGLHA